jgi:hypothetical protein
MVLAKNTKIANNKSKERKGENGTNECEEMGHVAFTSVHVTQILLRLLRNIHNQVLYTTKLYDYTRNRSTYSCTGICDNFVIESVL